MRFARSFLFTLASLSSALLHAQSTLPVTSGVMPPQTITPGGAPVTIDLRNHFSLPGVTGTIVQLNTVMGRFNIELFDDTPITKTNFLSYVNSGAYNGTFIHRSVANFVIQGGGYTYSVDPVHIPTGAPIRNEFRRANVRGTVAMAKTAVSPDTATSEWFVSLADNRANLDNQNGGFTVFARVLGNGMTVVDSIAALPRANINFSANVSLQDVPVRNVTAGQTQVQLQNLVAVNTATTIPIYPAGSSDAVLSFSATSANPAIVAASISGSILTLTPAAAGSATVTVTVTETNGGSASQIFAVTVGAAPSQAPEILTQPQAELVLASGTSHTVAFTVSASSASAMTYQWRRNGVALDGQQSPTCVLQNAADAQAGDYTCLVRNSVGSVVSQAAKLSFAPTAAPDQSRLTNLSVRTVAGTGARTLIVGFALGGAGRSGTAPLLVRGVGPSLAQFGLTGILPDPIATMGGGTPPSQVTNDNWATAGAAAVAERAAQVGAFALAPASLDAALAVSPAAASYTVQITDRENRTGIALAEIYEAVTRSAYTPTTPRLVNVSARTEVGTGSDILIAGFNISGTTAKTVLIRAIGPTLAQFGVNDTLADPKLQLFAGSKQLAGNDNWGGDAVLTTTGTAVGAFALPNSTSGDSVLLATLPPGSYTAQVSGANDGTGVALVEIYEVP